MKPVLLDTCALIWIAVSPERLSKKALHSGLSTATLRLNGEKVGYESLGGRSPFP